LWKKFGVDIEVRDKLIANLPTSFGALKYVAKRQLIEEEEKVTEEAIEERAEQLESELPEPESESEEVLLAFQRDDYGLFIEERNIKGLLKECAKTLKIRGARDAINHGVFIKPERIYLKRDDKVLKQADGIIRKGMRVIGPRGQRVFVKQAEYVSRPELSFTVLIVKSVAERILTDSRLKEIWELAQENGLLGDRSVGEGKFDVQVKPLAM